MRICQFGSCGNTFEPAKHNAKYCSKSCNQNEHNARRARLRAERLGELADEVVCQYSRCEEKFKPSRRNHKYCSDSCCDLGRGAARKAIGYDALQFVPTKILTAAQRKAASDTAHKIPNEIGTVRSVVNFNLAPDLSSHDTTNTREYDSERGAGPTPEQELQIRVLEEAIQHVVGRALCTHRESRDKLRDEAARWVRGDDDCADLGPFNSAACFDAAGIDQQAAIRSMGIAS